MEDHLELLKFCKPLNILIPFSIIAVIILNVVISLGEHNFDIIKMASFYTNLATLGGMGITIASIACLYSVKLSWAITSLIIIGWILFFYRMYSWKKNVIERNLEKIKENMSD